MDRSDSVPMEGVSDRGTRAGCSAGFTRSMRAAAVVAACGLAISARAQEATLPTTVEAPTPAPAPSLPVPVPAVEQSAAQPAAPPVAPAVVPAPSPKPIRFAFKDTPFDQVLDFIARETGLPVINEAPVPQGTCTFISAGEFDLDGAIAVVNQILLLHRVNLRREGDYLFLADMKRAVAAGGPVFVGEVPTIGSDGKVGGPAPADVVTVAIPLQSAKAETIAEQIKKMVADYGAVTPIPGQNMLVVVETAAQIKRIQQIVHAIDSMREVDSAYRLFPLRHAKADDVTNALKGLIGERQKMVIVDKDGNQRTVQEQSVQGLNLQPDPRTNAIIAVGSVARLKVVEELIALLDVPDSATANREVRTIPLVSVTPASAAERLNQLYGKLKPEEKPIVIPLAETSKVTMVGAAAAIADGVALLKELDPPIAGAGEAPDARTTSLVALTHLTPSAAQAVFQQIATPRQQNTIRLTPTPDGRGLLIAGPSSEVASVQAFVKSLDVPASGPRDLRQIRLAKGDPAAIVAEAKKLYASSGREALEPVEALLDDQTRTLTIVGQASAIARFAELVQTAAANAGAIDRETRLIDLTKSTPSAILPRVQELAKAVIPTVPGPQPPAPEFVAVDEVRAILLRATPEHIQVLDSLVRGIDRQQVQAVEARVYRLTKGDAASAANAIRTALTAAQQPGEPTSLVTPDAASNTLTIVGPPVRLTQAEGLIQTLDQRVGKADAMGVKTIPLRHARASTLVPVLESVLKRESAVRLIAPWQVPQYLAEKGPEPEVRVAAEPRLNAIVVSAPTPIVELAEQMVAQLDIPAAGGAGADGLGDRPLRIISLKNADAGELAANLQAVFADEQTKGGAGVEAPTIRVDRASNSLLVRATPGQFATLEGIAGQLDAAALAGARQVRTIAVDRSRGDAGAMALTLKKMMEQEGGANGLRVKVISAEELMQTPAAPPAEAPGAAAPAVPPAPVDASGKPRTSREPVRDALPAWLGAIATSVIAQPIVPPPFAVSPAASQPVAPPAPAKQSDDADVTIAVDPKTNSLVVIGSPRVTDRLAELAAKVEQQLPIDPVRVHIVQVPQGIEPWQVAQVVNQTAGLLGRSSATNPGGFTGSVVVTPDPTNSAVVVWANETDFPSIADLIKAVSNGGAPGGTGELVVKVYPLSGSNASRAMESIRDLLSMTPRWDQARRIRGVMNVTIQDGKGEKQKGSIDPSRVRLSADPAGTSLIVTAPPEALPLLDRFIELIDQSSTKNKLAIKRYTLVNAKAAALAGTLQGLFDSQLQGPNSWEMPAARFIADERTNSILLTASEPQHADATRLIATMDESLQEKDKDLVTRVLTLQNADPSTVSRVIDQIVVGRDAGKKERVRLSAEDGSSLLVVRAAEADLAEIQRIVAELDSTQTAGLPVRTLKVQSADAVAVANAINKFYQDRAAIGGRGGRRGGGSGNRVAVVGDRRSGSIVVTASDSDYKEIEGLVATLDVPAKGRQLQFKVVALANARANDIEDTIQSIAWELQWERMQGVRARGGQDGPQDDQLLIQTNERTNSVLLVGQGEAMETAIKVIAELDKPMPDAERAIARAVGVPKGDLNAIAGVVRKLTETPGWRFWQGADANAVQVEVDGRQRKLVLIGKQARVEQAIAYVKELAGDGAAGVGERVESVTLKHAQAPRVADNLRRFFGEDAQQRGLATPALSVLGSPDGNVLILSGGEAEITLAKQLIGSIDQPELGTGRRVEVYALKNAKSDEAQRALAALFPASGRSEDRVLVTPIAGGQSLAISAPGERQEEIKALMALVDAAPKASDSQIASVKLKSARAGEVAQALVAALPPSISVKVTPVARNNTLLLTGSDEAVKIVMERIAAIDAQPEVALEYKRVRLTHASADDVSFTLNKLLRSRPRSPGDPEPAVDYSLSDNTVIFSGTPDQLRDMQSLIASLDQPGDKPPKTEFVKLEFAKAEPVADALKVFYGRYALGAKTPGARNVTIVPDPASNSLVVSADDQEWEGIRALLKKLDTDEYDTSRQIAVVPMKHADATSVARALNDGLRAPLEDRARREQLRQQQENQRRQNQFGPFLPVEPTLLVDAEGSPTVSPEVQTNSLIVFAGQREMKRIKALVEQIDVASFAKLPDAAVIPVKAGRASQIAQTIREIVSTRRGGGGGQAPGPRSAVIVGDDQADALIVRAEERELAEIKLLAESLQQQGQLSRPAVRTIALSRVPAARLQRSLLSSFMPLAQADGEALAIEIDRTSNTLLVAASERLFAQIERVAKELDGSLPGANGANGVGAPPPGVAAPGAANGLANGAGGASVLSPGVRIIDLANTEPERMRQLLEQLGLTREQPGDRPGLVAEPITVVAMTTRRAIAVTAGPADAEAVAGLVKALDAEPIEGAEQTMAVVPLKLAAAPATVATLRGMLEPGATGQAGPGRALAEHLRRLKLNQNVSAPANQPDPTIDLNVAIRLIADAGTNSVVISSTPGNVQAIKEVIKTLDALPIGENVVVRFFPLANASSVRVKGVIDDLFRQGEQLRRIPGTTRQGQPTTATGKALAGEIAVTLDERTNAVIVAGREEAVALVEVLVQNMDSADAGKWVEPRLIKLKFADPVRLSQQLRAVLIQGGGAAPTLEAQALQRQVARLRIARNQPDAKTETKAPGNVPGADAASKPIDPKVFAEADLFAPMAGVVIEPQPELRSLIVVATPSNLDVVQELIGQLDVEAASPANSVRVYPLVRASADRAAATLLDVFRQRERATAAAGAGAFLAEDALVLSADPRTNSLIASTSAKSFAILEALVKTLDAAEANPTVGVHVVPVTIGDANALAPKVGRLMRERLAAAQQTGAVRSTQDVFSIEADAANNLLVVACSDENLKIVEELVATLSAGAEIARAGEARDIIQVTTGQADDVAAVLRQIYSDKENARRGPNSVQVVANDRLNAVIVTGTSDDIKQLCELARQVQESPVVTEQVMRRIKLRSANANEIVSVLREVLSGRGGVGTRGGGPRQAVKIKYLREQVAKDLEGQTGREPTEAQIDGIVRELVSLAPDLRSNSVMVNAPAEVMALIEEIIADLDTTELDRKIQLFKLANADARATAELLRDIFSLRQQGTQYVLVPTGQAGARQEVGIGPPVPGSGGGGIGDGDLTFTPVVDQRQQLSIAIDARTNTLVVSGTQEYLDRVGKVILDLDQIEAAERDRIVFHLRNAKAKDAEATLKNLFSGEMSLQRELLGPDQAGSAARQLEQEVTVVGDEKSNKLLITVAPRYASKVMELVKEIDTAPPQVMIQVMLAEVTVDSANNWGVDFRLKDITGENLNVQYLGGGAGVAAALGVPNLSFSSADFEVLVRALEVQGKLQVLSRPSVTANNNEQAEINVGDNVAVVTDVERLDNGNTRANVERRDLGIKLNVKPSISADGFVRMELEPSITSVSQRTTQVSEDFTAPIFTQRKVKTTVTVKDGQTVVIGGLIENRQEQRNTKVPLLGDIPAVGEIFKTHKAEDVKTELLVILTPKVIYNDRGTGVETFRNLSERQVDTFPTPEEVRALLDREGLYNNREMEGDGNEPRLEPIDMPAMDATPEWETPIPSPTPSGTDGPRAAGPMKSGEFAGGVGEQGAEARGDATRGEVAKRSRISRPSLRDQLMTPPAPGFTLQNGVWREKHGEAAR